MIDSDFTSKAVIIVRYFGNVYIGVKRFQLITDSTTEALQHLENGNTAISKLPLAKPTNPQPRKPAARGPLMPLTGSQPLRHTRPQPMRTDQALSASQPLPHRNRFAALSAPSTDDEVSFDNIEGSSRYASLDDLRPQEEWAEAQSGEWN